MDPHLGVVDRDAEVTWLGAISSGAEVKNQ
jgi:hypothetical protein